MAIGPMDMLMQAMQQRGMAVSVTAHISPYMPLTFERPDNAPAHNPAEAAVLNPLRTMANEVASLPTFKGSFASARAMRLVIAPDVSSAWR